MVSHKLLAIKELQIVSAAATYNANDQVGTKLEITNFFDTDKGFAELVSVVLFDKASQKISTDIFFFDESPTITSADQDAIAVSDAEMVDKCLGVVNVPAANYNDVAAGSVATVKNVGLVLRSGKAKSKSLWVIIVTRGTPSYGSTSDLYLRLGVAQG